MQTTELVRGNIYAPLAADRGAEHFDKLIKFGAGEMERIVSYGQASPEGFWYDQDRSEWVVVLRGHAKLEVEGLSELVDLGPGDYVNIAARCRHRVAWTSTEEATVWLAIHYE